MIDELDELRKIKLLVLHEDRALCLFEDRCERKKVVWGNLCVCTKGGSGFTKCDDRLPSRAELEDQLKQIKDKADRKRYKDEVEQKLRKFKSGQEIGSAGVPEVPAPDSVPTPVKEPEKKAEPQKTRLTDRIDKLPVKSTEPRGGGFMGITIKAQHNGETTIFKVQTPSQKPRFKRSVAVKKIADDIGWSDLTPDAGVSKLKTVIEHKGRKFDNPEGLFQEFVKGKSGDEIFREGDSDGRLKKVDGDRIRRIVQLDTLTGAQDRHPGNFIVDDSGKISLIDNDLSMGADKGTGVVESVFMGQTLKDRKHFRGMEKRITGKPWEDLDYRKFGGDIGKNYHPEFKAVVDKLAETDPAEVAKEHEIRTDEAKALVERARMMRDLGLEETVKKMKELYGGAK